MIITLSLISVTSRGMQNIALVTRKHWWPGYFSPGPAMTLSKRPGSPGSNFLLHNVKVLQALGSQQAVQMVPELKGVKCPELALVLSGCTTNTSFLRQGFSKILGFLG